MSENALELARLSSFRAAYFGNIDNWNTWLDTPNVQFDNQPPRTIMTSIRGRELIRCSMGLQRNGCVSYRPETI
ncbi:MAG: antitoxin Xre/MbcA/ParS toxin-binding domain-containing protein [Pseudoalteromonas prydzensis]|uniref:MbcA/ParS/Xre antitoxin family protein n=1 Tax=Pseudoalteromonas prydzensis TaxID=182141 RepID=UPI002657AD5C|nr:MULTISPECIES: MbcA/ParS/Xre antitoxin family protein [Pseudoalteromonas]